MMVSGDLSLQKDKNGLNKKAICYFFSRFEVKFKKKKGQQINTHAEYCTLKLL